MDLPPEAAEIAARQHGALHRRQLLHVGVGPAAIDHRLRTGRLAELHRGVYGAVGAPRTLWRDAWAAQLAMGPTAVVSGRSAAALHEMDRIEAPDNPTILVPYHDAPTRPPPGIDVVRSRTFIPEHGTTLRGLPIVTLQRLPVEVASDLRTGELAAVLREVVRRTGTPPRQLLAVAADAGNRAGTSRLRQLLREMDPSHARTASPAEGELLSLLTRNGLAAPSVNHTVFAPDGSVAGILDLAWPELMAAVELDSLRHHATTEAQAHDLERQQRLERLGWRFRRVTPRQVRRNGVLVVNLVREFLEQQRANLRR